MKNDGLCIAYLGLAHMVHHRDNGEWRQVLAASMVINLQNEKEMH